MPSDLGRALADPGRTTIQVPGSSDAPESDLVTGFANGFVFELLDIRESQPLQVHALVLNPQRYELTEPHSSTLTPTEDNTVVDESVGIIQRTVMIEGTFGVRKRAARAFEGAQGGGRELTGAEHFKGLRNMFRRYSLLKQSADAAAYIRLILHVLRDDDHLILAQPVFTTPRDVKSTRMHYQYRITAQAIGDAAEISRLRRRAARSGSDMLTEGMRGLSNAFHDARASFAEVNKFIGLIRGKIGNINAVMVNVGQFINAVGNAIGNVGALIQYPIQLAATVVVQVADAADFLAESVVDAALGPEAEAARSLRRIEEAIDRIVAFPERFEALSPAQTLGAYRGENTLTERDMADGTAGATDGSRTRVAYGSEGSAGFDTSDYRGSVSLRLTRGDTLEGLASRYGVPMELIILINDLSAPYFHPGGGPGLLSPGDEILIPTRELSGATGLHSTSSYFSIGDALYGVDLAIDMDRLRTEGVLDLRDPVSERAGDADLVHGLANVVQGAAITIYTERGSTAFLPQVGVNRNIGRKGTIEHVMLTSLNLREAILADSRIEGIAESAVVLDGDVLTQEITPIVTGRRRGTTLVLPFGRSSGV